MRFLFKYPTKGRPDWFKETLSAYYSKLSGRHQYQFIIAMDNDDKSMNNQPMRNWLNAQEHLEYFYADHANKTQACNSGIPDSGWDVLVLVSDDMTPIVDGFDDVIFQDYQLTFQDYDGALHYNDGKTAKALLTLSIMGRKLYERIGFVYWPAYAGTWCDNDFMGTVRMWDKYWYTDKTIIRHDWQKHGNDPVYIKGESTYHQDQAIYNKRKEQKFPVTFSQNDEDWIIRKYFKDKFNGRYLDIGIADGVTFSNTKILYDMGWTGVGVEPSPILCRNLMNNCGNGRVTLVQAALMPEDGPVELYDAQGDFISTTSEAHRQIWSQANYKKIGVDGISWNTLLAQYGSDFDFINIDIEGENIPMLQLMPGAYKTKAKMICVEYDGKANIVRAELEPYGFKEIKLTGENIIMGK